MIFKAKSLLLYAAIFSKISLAGNEYSCDKENAEEYILPAAQETPALNQDGLGVCYAAAATTQLEMLGNPNVSFLYSAISYANEYAKHEITNSKNDELYFEGGWTCKVFDNLKKHGYCKSYLVPLEDQLKSEQISSYEYEMITKDLTFLMTNMGKNTAASKEIKLALTDLYEQSTYCKNNHEICNRAPIINAYIDSLKNEKPSSLAKSILPKSAVNYAKARRLEYIHRMLSDVLLDYNNVQRELEKDQSTNDRIESNMEEIYKLQENIKQRENEINKKCIKESCLHEWSLEENERGPLLERFFSHSSLSAVIYDKMPNKYNLDIHKSFYALKDENRNYEKTNFLQSKKRNKIKETRQQLLFDLEKKIDKFYNELMATNNNGDSIEEDLLERISSNIAETDNNKVLPLLYKFNLLPTEGTGTECRKLLSTMAKYNQTGRDYQVAKTSYAYFELVRKIIGSDPTSDMINRFDDLHRRAIDEAMNDDSACHNVRPRISPVCASNPGLSESIHTLLSFAKNLERSEIKKMMDHWDEKPLPSRILNIFGPYCADSQNLSPIVDVKSCREHDIYDSNVGQSVKVIKKQLELKKPVGLYLCAKKFLQNLTDEKRNVDVIKYKDECGNHAVSVVGSRCVGGKIQFLMRNSWGSDCSFYSLDHELGESCIPEKGDVWYDAKNLMKISLRYQTYE